MPDESRAFEQEIETVIAGGDEQELLGVVIEIAMAAEDRAWAEVRLLELAAHPNTDVRGNALIGFAHLADRLGALEPARVRPAIEAGLTDAERHVRDQAEAARDALREQLGWWEDVAAESPAQRAQKRAITRSRSES
jgi:hypothetical protein